MCWTFHSSNGVRGLPEGHSSAVCSFGSSVKGQSVLPLSTKSPSPGTGDLFGSSANHVHNNAGLSPGSSHFFSASAKACSCRGGRWTFGRSAPARPARGDLGPIEYIKYHVVRGGSTSSTHNCSSRSQCATLFFFPPNRPQNFKLSTSETRR